MTKPKISIGDTVIYTHSLDKPHTHYMSRFAGKPGRVLDRSTHYSTKVFRVAFSSDNEFWVREDSLTLIDPKFKRGDAVVFIYEPITPHTPQMQQLSGMSGKVTACIFNPQTQVITYHVRIRENLWAINESSLHLPKDRKITLIRKPLNNSNEPNIIKE